MIEDDSADTLDSLAFCMVLANASLGFPYLFLG